MFEKKGDLFGVHQKAVKKSFSIDDYLQLGMISRFVFEMQSDALSPYITTGDLLLVDRALNPGSGDFILATLNDEFVCRRFEKQGRQRWLVSRYGKKLVETRDRVVVFGVIVAVARKYK